MRALNGFHNRLLACLAEGVADARDAFDGATGRFLAANGGWATTNQDVIYPLALLYKTPGTRVCGDRSVLELVWRGGDALRDSQDAQGRFDFVKTDGSRWGRLYMPWSMYHWLEAYGLTRDELDPERRRRWEQGLRLCFNGSADELRASQAVHNIPTWHAMALVRASQLLDEPRWLQVGTDGIRRTVTAQHDDGYWPEGGGPAMIYNLIYTHAIGLYYWFTTDASVLGALGKALDFHATFTYPDGVAVETVDGRCRYFDKGHVSGLPGFAALERGRTYCRFLLDNYEKSFRSGDPNRHLMMSSQAMLPHLAATCQHVPPFAEPDGAAPPSCDYGRIHNGHALVRRRGAWFHCLSGYLLPTDSIPGSTRNRWILDRQSYLSVWHERAGLIAGGGNAKHSATFSTFEVITGRVVRIQADTAELRQTPGGDRLRLTYGETVCDVLVNVRDDRSLSISFSAADPAGKAVSSIAAGFCMPLLKGRTVSGPLSRGETVLDALTTHHGHWPAHADDAERWLRIGKVRVDVPPGASFTWPEYPFCPYIINNASEPEEAVGVFSVPLQPAGAPATFLLTVSDP